MAGMKVRAVLLVLVLAAAGTAVWAIAAAHSITGSPPAFHTIYCRHGDNPPVSFLAGGGLGSGCPPGFRPANG